MATLSKENFQLAEQRSFGQAYPVYANNLKEVGVHSYTVTVATHDRRIFSGTHQPALEIPGNITPVVCEENFDYPAFKKALRRTQAGQSDYPTFMREIAAAGVHFYTADLLARTVTYFGKGLNDQYEESIPPA